jgi:hypothetical protein
MLALPRDEELALELQNVPGGLEISGDIPKLTYL